ncbi:MAG: transglycosylase SLT domain-containing protein [Acidobacteriota bacterium]
MSPIIIRRLLLFAPLILTASFLSGSSQEEFVPALRPAPTDSPPPGVLAKISLRDHLAPFGDAAEALRAGDCSTAMESLSAAAAGEAPQAAVRLARGFHAHACEDIQAAEQLLAAGWNGSELEDWRLYLLADAAAAAEHGAAAEEAFEALLSAFPTSHLAPRALLRSTELAHLRDDPLTAAERIERGRRADLPAALRGELERIAWELGTAQQNLDLLRSARRYLLTEEPLVAQDLELAEALRQPSGEIAWELLLEPSDLTRRAVRLIEVDLPGAAWTTLNSLPDGERGADWSLLAARALTADRRGARALQVLASQETADPVVEGRLNLARAEAALDAATARKGRTNLPTAERKALRKQALVYLDRAARRPELAATALTRMFRLLDEPEQFEQALDVLQRLRTLDPDNTLGAKFLWQLGWREFERRNASGAIGYWAELGTLYPESRYRRAGTYWSGRAFERLGEKERADQVFHAIAAADTTDFYRRFALTRLDLPAENPGPAAARPWPSHPRLDRALLLSDLGLDHLAMTEMDAVIEAHGDAIPESTYKAHQSAVFARQGKRVESIRRIRQAFPALGSAEQAGVPERALELYYPVQYEDLIRRHARDQGLPLHLVLGMIRQESAFDLQAQSWAGARGLMQLMPATGREVAGRLGLRWSRSRLADPAFNVQLGTAYFREVLAMFDGNVELALAGYNGGPYRIKRLWRQSPDGELDVFVEGLKIEESRNYVKRILLLSDSYRRRVS